MLYLIRIELTEERAVYEYHPNGGDDYGIVSVERKTGICSLDKFEPKAGQMHSGMALSGIRKLFNEDIFPEKRVVAWY